MPSPLVRIPLTLVTAAAFHVSMSPPSAPNTPLTPHPDADKRANRRTIYATARFIATMITKGVYWMSAVADTSILLAPYLHTFAPLISHISIPSISPAMHLPWISHPTAWIPTVVTVQTCLLNFHLSHLPLLTIAGTTLALSGAFLRSAAFRALGRFYACTNTGPGPCKPARRSRPNGRGPYGHAHALITSGPYGYVRHPGYAGLVLCTLGLVALHVEALSVYWGSGGVRSSRGIVDEVVGMGVGRASVGMRTIALVCTILSTVGAIRRIRVEERALRARFKGEWEAWAERVPYKLFPGVY